MRKYLAGGLVLALAVGITGTAVGKSTFTDGDVQQGIDFKVSKKGKRVFIESGPLDNPNDPTAVPDKAQRVRLRMSKDWKFDTKKFPRCKANLESSTDVEARQLCGKSQVSKDGDSKSQATAALPFGPGGTRTDVGLPVTAFNGKPRSGNPVIILHTFLDAGPFSQTTVLTGVLKDTKGKTKKKKKSPLLDVNNIPPIGGGTGALVDFFSTIQKKTKSKGKTIQYFSAKCKNKKHSMTGTWNFASGKTVSGTDTQKCKKKTGDTK